ncbi:glutaminyl-peptide cyclotransferase-like isoform X1 [Trichogramma pretiosum]|uniref:glutaminyl-peptide cyclotransferase-like isoform X1 n=1 Tax=Trichogramma pretiosum TaxID=7493 RepID=UPI0006C981D0|nr:glutaminyl-peptide cyclotransferase-like isoform X1 [Trichogramma pretiosum]
MRGTGVGALFLFLPLLVGCCQSAQNLQHRDSVFRRAKLLHKASPLSQAQMYKLATLSDHEHMDEVLDNICIPRVVASPGHQKVKQYIKSRMRELGWTVESDHFEEHTPLFGKLHFENIVAKWNPNAERYLTLACHYDSKYEKNYEFVGATDSAVPCMQLINLAKVMQEQLNAAKQNDEVSLMLLFFDGEEAFKSWGPKDSIYGARHLADKWHKTRYIYREESEISDLDRMDMLVLLDLLGAPKPIFYNYFNNTLKWYSLLSEAEDYLASANLLQNYDKREKYFQKYTFPAGIEDDHIPFLRKNVPILHLIPYPFPDFWHTEGDNRSAVDMATVENLNKILRIFVASYLNLPVEEDNVQSGGRSDL